MVCRIFSQLSDVVDALPAIVRQGSTLFDVSVEVLAAERSPVPRVDVRADDSATFRVTARAATEADRADATAAEARGRAGGMSALAARCGTVWVLEAEHTAAPEAQHALEAVLASVALGPVLPEDSSTLYGVRGALERRDRLRRAR